MTKVHRCVRSRYRNTFATNKSDRKQTAIDREGRLRNKQNILDQEYWIENRIDGVNGNNRSTLRRDVCCAGILNFIGAMRSPFNVIKRCHSFLFSCIKIVNYLTTSANSFSLKSVSSKPLMITSLIIDLQELATCIDLRVSSVSCQYSCTTKSTPHILQGWIKDV